MDKKVESYLIAVSRDGKVIDLQFSDDLVDLRAIKLKYTVEKGFEDCEIEVLPVYGSIDSIGGDVGNRWYSRNGKPANRITCVETGEVFSSVGDCYRKTGIPPVSIYKSIRTGNQAFGRHFEYFKEFKGLLRYGSATKKD